MGWGWLAAVGCVLLALASSARADEPAATATRTIAAPLRHVELSYGAACWWPFTDPRWPTRIFEYQAESVATISVSLRGIDDPALGAVTIATCTASIPGEGDDTPSRRFARSWELAAGACDRLAARVMRPPVRTDGYGAQIVIADALALLTLGMAAPFTGPVVHLAHERPLRALGSFALRVGAISVTTALALGISLLLPPAASTTSLAWCGPISGTGNCPPDPNYVPQALAALPIGGAIGWFVASVLDATLIARPGYAYLPFREP